MKFLWPSQDLLLTVHVKSYFISHYNTRHACTVQYLKKNKTHTTYNVLLGLISQLFPATKPLKAVAK